MGGIPAALRGKYNRIGWTANGIQAWGLQSDPIEKFHSGGGVAGGLMTAHLMQPQNPELGRLLYDAAANALGWRSATGPANANTTGLVMAKEMGDDVAYKRLSEAAERQYEPRFFGEHHEKFGWFFNNAEAFPRGQGSAMLMAAEIAGAGDWTRAFEAPHLDKYTAPTVEGIEFPSLGVSQAWNDRATGTLHVVTYAAAPDKRGAATRWRVTNLPTTANLTVRLNGQPVGLTYWGSDVTGPMSSRERVNAASRSTARWRTSPHGWRGNDGRRARAICRLADPRGRQDREESGHVTG